MAKWAGMEEKVAERRLSAREQYKRRRQRLRKKGFFRKLRQDLVADNEHDNIELPTSTSVVLNQVKIPFGAYIGKEFILEAIGIHVEDFKPVLVKLERKDMFVYVDNDEVAKAIRGISRRIWHPATHAEVRFYVERISAESWSVSRLERHTIETVLLKRYDRGTATLDLTKFEHDEEFVKDGMQVALFHNKVMLAVAEIIDKQLGDVQILIAKDNRLRHLWLFSSLVYRITNVRVLDLSNNDIKNMDELEKLRGWPLESISLDNNPLCSYYGSSKTYVDALHNIFPSVTTLDGCPTVEADVVSKPKDRAFLAVPVAKPSFYQKEDWRILIKEFLGQYFTVYDDPDAKNRRNLLSAYDENASFSVAAEHLRDQAQRPFFTTYREYRVCSHNIAMMKNWSREGKDNLRKGAADIVSALSSLPPTKHVEDTFIIDIQAVLENRIIFCVQGIFHEEEEPGTEERNIFFSRNFVLKWKGGRKVSILSDMLFLSGLLPDRFNRYMEMLQKLDELPPNVTQCDLEEVAISVAESVSISATVTEKVEDAINQLTVEESPESMECL